MSARLELTAYCGPNSSQVITGWIEPTFDHRLITGNHDYSLAMRWGRGEDAQHTNIIALAFYPVEGGMYVMSAWYRQGDDMDICTDAIMYSPRTEYDAVPGNIWPIDPRFLYNDIQLRFTGLQVDRIADDICLLGWNIERHASGYVVLSNNNPQYWMLHEQERARPPPDEEDWPLTEDFDEDDFEAGVDPDFGGRNAARLNEEILREFDVLDLTASPRGVMAQDRSVFAGRRARRSIRRREGDEHDLEDADDSAAAGPRRGPLYGEAFLEQLSDTDVSYQFAIPTWSRHPPLAAALPRHAGPDSSNVSTLYAGATDDDKAILDAWTCCICHDGLQRAELSWQHAEEVEDWEELDNIAGNIEKNELLSAHAPSTPNLHHVFHRKCLEHWYGNSRSCPTCRDPLVPRPLPDVWSPGNTKMQARMETKLLTTHAARNPYITSM